MPLNITRHTGLVAHARLQRARAGALAGAARRAARLLEQQGRQGDRHLVHVNDTELAAMRGAFGPHGAAGRRNPVTGRESFAPEDESEEDVSAPEAFAGQNPDGSGYTVRLPLASQAPAVAAFDLLTQIPPRAQSGGDSAQPMAPEEDSWGTLLRKAADNAVPQLTKSIGGVARAAGDALSAQPTVPSEVGMPDAGVQGYAPPAAQRLANWGAGLHDNAVADLAANAPNVDPNSLKGYAYGIASALPNALLLLGSAATGTAIPAMGALALQGFGERYGDARQQGRSATEASTGAAAHAVAASLPAALPVGVLMRPGGTFLGRTLAQIGAGGAQSALTQALDEAYDKGIVGADTSWGEAWDRIQRAGLIGAATGAVTGAAGAALPRRANTSRGTDNVAPQGSRTDAQAPDTSDLAPAVPASSTGASATPTSVVDQFEAFRRESGLSASQAVSPFLLQVAKDTGHEHVVAIDARTREPIDAVTSAQTHRADLSDKMIQAIGNPDNQIELHHNHPGNESLSPDDLKLLAYPGLEQIFAHSPDGTVSSARLASGFRTLYGDLSPEETRQLLGGAVAAAEDGATPVLERSVKVGSLDEQNRHMVIDEIINRALAAAGLTVYNSNKSLAAALRPADLRAASDNAFSRVRRYLGSRVRQSGDEP